MSLKNLDNLVKAKQLKLEAFDQAEFDGLIVSGKRRLQDAQIEALSDESRFALVYGAAHALSLAALRWYGYRSDNRYLVFQCLQETLKLDNGQWRLLDKCHKLRNLAEYEGQVDITPQLLQELLDITALLSKRIETLV